MLRSETVTPQHVRFQPQLIAGPSDPPPGEGAALAPADQEAEARAPRKRVFGGSRTLDGSLRELL